MKKVLKKLLATMLSVALVAGAVNLVPMEVSAEGTNITPAATSSEDLSFTGDQLVNEWENASSTANGTQWNMTFAEAYQQAKFKLPQQIDLSKCNSVTFAVSEQNCVLAFKIYTTEDSSEASWVQYNCSDKTLYTFDLSSYTDTITHVGVMLNTATTEEGATSSCVFDGVYFDMIADTTTGGTEEGGTEGDGTEGGTVATNITPALSGTEDLVFKAADLTYEWGESTRETTTASQVKLGFAAQYGQAVFTLTNYAKVDLSKCKTVTFAVSEQSGPIAFKLIDDSYSEISGFTKYSQSGKTLYTYDVSGMTNVVTQVGVMLDADLTDQTFVFDGVYFDMMSEEELNPEQGGEGGEGGDATTNITPALTGTEDLVFKAGDLTYEWGESTQETTDANQVKLGFAAQYGQAVFTLTNYAKVDLSKCKTVTFAVSEQSGPIAFKLIDDSYSEIGGFTKYSQSGKTLYTYDVSGMTSIVTQVGLMLDANLTDQTFVFDGVYFDMMTDEEIAGNQPVEDTTANITPSAASSEDKVFKGDVLTGSGSTGTLGGMNGDEWKINFAGQWSSFMLELPEAIDLSMCNSVTFAVSEQTGSLSFKLFKTVDGTATEITDLTTYGQTDKTLYTYTFAGRTEVVTHIAVMLDKDLTGQKCSLDGVVFDMMTEKQETYTITYTADQFTLGTSNVQSAQIKDGKLAIQYSELNQQAKFILPTAVNFGKCLSITVKVSAQDGPVNFYSYSDGASVDTFNYKVGSSEYVLAPTADKKVDTIGVQTGGSEFTEGANITIDSITFLMEGKEPQPLPADGVVTATFFEVEKSAGVTTAINETTGVMDVTFTNVGDSIDFEIPDTVDVAHLANIKLDLEVLGTGLSAQSLDAAETVEGVTISLLDADKNVIVTGNVNVLEVNGNDKAKYIRVTTTVADQNLQLTSITFEMDMTIVGDIVKNGYFAEDDMTMWDGVTRVNNGTAFIDGETFTTYGEIVSRTSNYACFQQDISSRVEAGKFYAITFWAKLSDDYADASASMRTITFNPYYINAAGDPVYGTVPTAGTVQKVCEVGEWTKFVAAAQVPAGATGFVIRIMEQGLNYGAGDGIKGSYAVAGISMQETAPFAVSSSGSGRSGAFYDTRTVNYSEHYTMDDLAVEWASATFETVDGKMTVNFSKQYDEVRMKLPRAFDASEIVSFKVNVSGENVPIAIKLYSKGSMIRVEYFNTVYEDGQTYTVCPNMSGEVDGIGIMTLAADNSNGAYADITSVTINFVEEPDPLPVRSTIVANGDFANADLSDWHAAYWGQDDGVSMFHEVSAKAFGDGVTNYASYNKRTSPYQCFAQDITGYVEQNEIYTFSFWAKLSDDYIGAPDTQRIVQFSPYTVDKDGVADYNPKLEGTYLQVLEPGVWTKFEGKYKVTNANEVAQVVIRIIEQGTDYGQGDCVLGGYSIADVKMDLYVPDPPSIDEDVPNLDETLMSVFGDDFIVGNSLTVNGIDDLGTSMLLNKHFNAITIGNELKPDALFGYSNSQHTKLQTITFNGQELVVPTLDYTRAEMVLDKIVKWNKENPDHQFKVRGHVLVWHAQTPEWFFRENYVVGQNADGSENYVSAEEMSLRLEWYIKTVLEHFTGEDSEYKDLFYGWDVVNEAVSDGSGSYRTDKIANGEKPSDPTHGSNSSWWAVYGSNEYIIKAFQFANKYAPAELELYYNDYNECNNTKVKGIVQLLTDVLAAEGTRIDAMGMQAHYNLMNPSVKMFEDAIRAYAAVVGKVQITEFDLKASRDLSTEKNLQEEYLEQSQRYLALYECLKKLDAEDGIDITGITFWGVSDKDSWLQSSSNVGGGADGTMTQCPLLFDGNYKVKPAFWAFVDYTKVDPTYGQEPEKIVDEDTPTGDVDPEKDASEEKTDESQNSGNADQAGQSQDSNATSGDATKSQGKKTNAVPLVAAGVVAVILVAGGAALVLKKKK